MTPNSPMVKNAWGRMTDEQKQIFKREYGRRNRDMTSMILLSILFPIQLALLKQVGLFILFVLTFGGAGIWWIIEMFLTPARVRSFNQQVEREILVEMGLGHLTSLATDSRIVQ